MTVTVTLRERGSNAFLELRSLFIIPDSPAPLTPLFASAVTVTVSPANPLFQLPFASVVSCCPWWKGT